MESKIYNSSVDQELFNMRERRKLKPDVSIPLTPVEKQMDDRCSVFRTHEMLKTRDAEREYSRKPKENIPDMKKEYHALNSKTWLNPFAQITYTD